MKEINVIPFSLSFLYIVLNLRNGDKSIPNVNEINTDNIGFYETLSLLSLNNFFQSNTVFISFTTLNVNR